MQPREIISFDHVLDDAPRLSMDVLSWSRHHRLFPGQGELPVARFLAKSPVSFPVALAGLEGVELTRALGNAAGGLPFSVLFDATGQLRDRKLGQLHARDLAAWRDRLGRSCGIGID